MVQGAPLANDTPNQKTNVLEFHVKSLSPFIPCGTPVTPLSSILLNVFSMLYLQWVLWEAWWARVTMKTESQQTAMKQCDICSYQPTKELREGAKGKPLVEVHKLFEL